MLTQTQPFPNHMRQSNITNATQSISEKPPGGVFRIQLYKIIPERERMGSGNLLKIHFWLIVSDVIIYLIVYIVSVTVTIILSMFETANFTLPAK